MAMTATAPSKRDLVIDNFNVFTLPDLFRFVWEVAVVLQAAPCIAEVVVDRVGRILIGRQLESVA
jgi:hypothetical protein